jgi:hydroxyacylglutathione hydrolase
MAAIIAVPAFSDNYVWMLHDGTHAVVVDPGDAAPVLDRLASERLRLAAILATHHHNDHVGGIPALRERFDVPVYGPAGETIPQRTRALREGDSVDVGELRATFAVLDIPGHTRGHIAFTSTLDGRPLVFCGDTLFAAGCGKLFEGTPAQMWSSLCKLAALPSDTRVFCGHEYTLSNLAFARAVEPGNAAIAQRIERERAKRVAGQPTVPAVMADERATNPFLRAGVPAVRDAAQRHAGRTLEGDVDVFAALRAWKNEFRG